MKAIGAALLLLAAVPCLAGAQQAALPEVLVSRQAAEALNLSVGAGLTRDTPDLQVTARLPITF